MATEESQTTYVQTTYNPLVNPTHSRPVLVDEQNHRAGIKQKHIFLTAPLSGALLFENNTSDARDHCANERTFLSWLRLSMYLAIVAMAIIISFHFRQPPTELEKRMALPLGLVFWVLSLASLGNGFANYVGTVRKYSRRAAIVQSGWKTQVMFGIVGGVILGSCIVFLVTEAREHK